MTKPAVILLFGPTGVGKTHLVDRLFAGRGEVISADALQVYRDLNIGTAKPDDDILSRIPHHLINILHYNDSFSVADFCRLADAAVADIHARGLIPVLSGGTAYYLKSWLLGLPGTPEADPAIRDEIESNWKGRSDSELKEALRKVDPVSADRLGDRDRYRMLRALEVHRQTGRPLSGFAVPETPRTDCRILSLGLRRDRAELYRRINLRVEQMLSDGLEAEVDGLRADGATADSPGMKAIGYREWFGTGAGKPSVDEVRELISRNSRRYAKRQITFFSSLPDVRWYDLQGDRQIPTGLAGDVDLFLGSE